MTLEEAIKYAEEVAEEHENAAQIWHKQTKNRIVDFCDKAIQEENNCTKCAEEHRQLTEWLKELKQLREQTRWIPISERLPDYNDIVLASTDSDYDELKVILTVYSGEEFWFNGKIKAWRSKPKSYEPQESEE